jgi:trehalose synthase-fused probable maltokinase
MSRAGLDGAEPGRPGMTELVPEEALVEFVRAQRWFGSKSSDLSGTRIADAAELREGSPRIVHALVDARLGSGTHETYQLIFGETGRDARGGDAPGPTIDVSDGTVVYEALADPSFIRELFHLLRGSGSLGSGDGLLEFCATAALTAEAPAFDSVRPVELEQSNSSVIVNDELIVKAYRRVEAGVNPELEMLRFFVQHGFEHVPKLVGWWSYAGPPLSASLGIVQQFVAGATDGWSLALDELPARAAEFAARVDRLGAVVGEMHAVLSSDASDPVFSPEEASSESLSLLTATVDDQIAEVFASLPDDAEVLAPIAGRGDDVRDLLHGLTTVGSVGKRIRHHGDLHLGQTLWADGDWTIIDFEGEPARGLTERRLKASPLRDVAGMLRSFTYAVSVSGVDPELERTVRERFLESYYEAMRPTGVLPPRETAERLIRIFELEKAVYELGYELEHRPDWIWIPVTGIVRLLAE